MKNKTQQVILNYSKIDKIFTALSLGYLIKYYLFISENKIMPPGVEELLSDTQLSMLHSLFSESEEDINSSFSFYAGLHISNKLLHTDDGKAALLDFMRLVVENPNEKGIKNTIKQLTDSNNLSIGKSGEKISHLPGFNELEVKLSSLRF